MNPFAPMQYPKGVSDPPKKLKTIGKEYKTLKAAERYQNRLYDQYSTVRLIQCPMWSEDGLYIWEVGN